MSRKILLLSLLTVLLISCLIVSPPPTETPTPTPEPVITPIPESSACPYLLPYPSSLGKKRVSQGNGGNISHGSGTYSEFGFDFDLEKGDPVYPARHGWVERIKNNSTVCGGRDKINDANYVIIRHKEEDGSYTYAQYLHLQNNIPVEDDQEVWPNQTILGYVGNTGYTNCGPKADKGYHLHFQVSNGPELVSQSIPICFDDVPGDGIPIKDGWYQSQNGTILQVTISPPDIPTSPPPTPPPPTSPPLPSDTFFLDTRSSSAESSIILASSHRYSVKISGTYSYWTSLYWNQYGVCSGNPDSSPMFPSSGVTNGIVGQDAYYFFAVPYGPGASDICGIETPPFFRGFVQLSTNGGSSYFVPNVVTEFNNSHIYEFTVIGIGKTLLIKFIDSNYEDNYGQLKIEITP